MRRVPELIRRPLRRDDIPACVELLAAAEAVDCTGENLDADDLVHEFDDPAVDAGSDTLALLDGTRLVAYGLVAGQAEPGDVHHVRLMGGVHPEFRCRGIGRVLLGWQLARGAVLHAEHHPGRTGRLGMWVPDHVPGAVALARSAGLAPVRHWFEMECEVAEPLPVPSTPLRLVPYHVTRDDEVRLARNDAFTDHYGSSPRNEAEWRQHYTGSPGFRPELSLLALDGDEIVSCLLSYVYPADIAATGVREVWIGTLGTRPVHRGRGAASALLAAGLSRYREAGYERAALGVDAANPTGALRIYERLGFRTVRTATVWACEVPPG